MSEQANYTLPEGIVGLKGPVARPLPGTLPLRGDLAHIALAEHYLAAHYVIPMKRTIGQGDAVLKYSPSDDAPDGETFAAGDPVELLDIAGDWAWICKGPEGPSGYVHLSALAPDDSASDAQ